jgi:hypothetical protein
VRALKRVHGWLRPGGVLLDLHPEPQPPRIDVALGGLAFEHLGRIDTSALIANIHAARASLAAVVEQQLFGCEDALVFDFVSHFASVDDWLHHRQQERATGRIDPLVIERAREVLSAHPSAELRVTERERATRLRRASQ